MTPPRQWLRLTVNTVGIYSSEIEIILGGELVMVRDFSLKSSIAELFIGQSLVADLTLKPMYICKSLGFASLIHNFVTCRI